jgi:hypothetical protein
VVFTTHELSDLNTPLTVVTDSERRQRTRMSKPPFNSPGAEEFAVIARVPISALRLPSEVRHQLELDN